MEQGDILGHEFMGEVVEVGSEVKNLTNGRPRGRAVHDLLRQLLLLPEGDLWSLCDNSNPNARMAEEDVRLFAIGICSATRT